MAVQPHGTTFQVPATVTMSISGDLLPPNTDVGDVAVFYAPGTFSRPISDQTCPTDSLRGGLYFGTLSSSFYFVDLPSGVPLKVTLESEPFVGHRVAVHPQGDWTKVGGKFT